SPFGVGPRRRQTIHVVDRFRENGHAIEWAEKLARFESCVCGARVAERRARKRVDRAIARTVASTSLERTRGHFDCGPLTTSTARLIVGDRAVERIGGNRRPVSKRTRKGDQRGELRECIAPGE